MMFTCKLRHFSSISALTLALCACGGGGGPSAFVPQPIPAPPPTPTPGSVTIFAAPKVEEFASVGASVSGLGGNLDTYPSASSRFGPVSSADQDTPHIRYTAAGNYEIEMPGGQWDRLVPYKGLVDPPPTTNYFQPQSVPQNEGYLVTTNARDFGYSYSEFGAWGSRDAGRWGFVAFGDPTPAGAVPVTGLGTFSGTVRGSADVLTANLLYGGYDPTFIEGSVNLNFDFAKGTLGGAMDLLLTDQAELNVELGSFAFKDTVYAMGSTTYSGKFTTAATSGDNFFLGRFTGPHAEETIGAWAVPFLYSGDNQTHQAMGAWIAKKP
jgi:hypothetical protein